MDFNTIVASLFPKTTLIFIAIRVVSLAIVFEFVAWWAGRRVEKMASPFITLDTGREPKWRATRRATLRQAPKIVLRSLLYTIALILVFNIFGLPVLELSLSVAAITALFGVALLPLMRDYAQGYVLLSEDTLAPGDIVEIGPHAGQVEKWTLRATWLRDSSSRLHVISNRDVRDVIVHRRAADEESMPKIGTFDPLDAAPTPRKK